MKKLILSLLIMLPSLSFCQVFDFGKMIDDKIKAFGDQCDSFYKHTYTTTAVVAVNIDTLHIPVNTVYAMTIQLGAKQGFRAGTGTKIITVSNANNVYTIETSIDQPAFKGSGPLLLSTWSVAQISGGIVIRVTPLTAQRVDWTEKIIILKL